MILQLNLEKNGTVEKRKKYQLFWRYQMNIEEIKWDVEIALEKMEFWRPIYTQLLKEHPRDEALDILKWLIEVNG